ncbi:MAG: hypothetical protein LBN03_01440, partial [Bifidobacteriaceae bacterium]|nr:hypothetical protein [Bifidobacteriaceae bacterium]
SDKNAMADSRADSKDDSDNLTLAKNIFNTTTTTTSSIKEVPKVSNVSTQPALFDADDLFGVSNNSSNSVPDTIADVAVAENSVTD